MTLRTDHAGDDLADERSLPQAQVLSTLSNSASVDSVVASEDTFWKELACATQKTIEFHLVEVDGENGGAICNVVYRIRTVTGHIEDHVYIIGLRTAATLSLFRVVPRPTNAFGAFLVGNLGFNLGVAVGVRYGATLRQEMVCYGYINQFRIDNNFRAFDRKRRPHHSVCFLGFLCFLLRF
jgi:hypothetical protein